MAKSKKPKKERNIKALPEETYSPTYNNRTQEVPNERPAMHMKGVTGEKRL